MRSLKSLEVFKLFKKKLINSALHTAYKLNISDELTLKLLSKSYSSIILRVPLSWIKHFIPNHKLTNVFRPLEVRKPNVPGFIWDGDWDLNTLVIDREYKKYSESYNSMIQIFREGYHYRYCDEYITKAELIKRGVKTARGESLDDLNKYFESLISIKKMIEINGYRSQKELNKKDIENEIGVFIDRSGNIIKAEDNFSGTHRFGIAKVLQLPEVYINIIAVHKKWAKANMESLIDKKDSLVEELKLHNR